MFILKILFYFPLFFILLLGAGIIYDLLQECFSLKNYKKIN